MGAQLPDVKLPSMVPPAEALPIGVDLRPRDGHAVLAMVRRPLPLRHRENRGRVGLTLYGFRLRDSVVQIASGKNSQIPSRTWDTRTCSGAVFIMRDERAPCAWRVDRGAHRLPRRV